MTKLSSLLFEQQKSKYKFRNIGGGFSDGVDIIFDQASSQFLLEVNLYGTKPDDKISFKAPASMQSIIQAYAAALNSQDPIASEIKQSIDQYTSQLRQALNNAIINALKQFDTEIGNQIVKSITDFNKNYK